jgi:IS1 family transposase
MANRLSTEQRARIVGCLVEGMSIRATVRATGAAKNTIVKLLADLGAASTVYMDGALTGLETKTVECDEIWSFCYAKAKNVPEEFKGTPGYGDVWTWVAIDADTKLVPSWLVGERTQEDAIVFLSDLASRLRYRVQITTDALNIYRSAIGEVFGRDVDFAQLRKQYGDEVDGRRTYSPAKVMGVEVKVRNGDPDPERISTSYVERQNLTMRMGMRRFTRLTNGFSKKVENLAHAVSLHFMHYNFCRAHQTLSREAGRQTTPAMAAGKADHVWTLVELAGLLDPN